MRKTDLKEPKTLLNQKEKQKPFPIFLFPFYFIILILLMIGESITAQVIIKERIPINPEAKKEISQFNITSSTEYLWVQVSGEADWSAILEGPCGARAAMQKAQAGQLNLFPLQTPRLEHTA